MKNNKNYLLVQKNKGIELEIPDNFPLDQIPNFSNYLSFESWCKEKGFKFTFSHQEDNDLVYRYSSHDIKNRKSGFLSLINELEINQNLIQGKGFSESVALSIAPEGYLKTLMRSILPIEVYKKFKDKLLKKYPKYKFSDLILKILKKDMYFELNNISENFLEFLYEEKINLSTFNFYEFSFTDPGAFEDKDDWDESSAPPFSARKTELLLKMCSKTINNDQIDYIKKDLKKLIESEQLLKMELILKQGALPKSIIKSLMEEIPDMPSKYQLLILKQLE